MGCCINIQKFGCKAGTTESHHISSAPEDGNIVYHMRLYKRYDMRYDMNMRWYGHDMGCLDIDDMTPWLNIDRYD